MKRQIKKTIAIVLATCFVLSITATAVSADASFTAVRAPSDGSHSVAFTDTSTVTYPIRSWSWDFGDGETSSLQNPTHKFQKAGSYDVTLRVVYVHYKNVYTSEVTKTITAPMQKECLII
jgi:PKD repeat protein